MLRAFLTLLCFFMFCSQHLSAQLHKSHWYFGIDSGIRFEDGEPKSDPNTNPHSYGGSVSMSDSSGNLLFYTSRTNFFNRNSQVMLGSPPLKFGLFFDAIALPSTSEVGVYFVYVVFGYNLEIYKVDMQKDGGLGEVTYVGDFIPPDAHFLRAITAVKDCQSNSYWLLTAQRIKDNTDAWFSYKVDITSGHITQHSMLPIDVEVDLVPNEMITSSNGAYVVLLSSKSSHIAEFDPRCGRFIKSTILDLPKNDITPRGACFSPNDNYLYLTYSGRTLPAYGWIYQIDYKNLNASDLYKNFMQTYHALYGILGGPDNRLYLLTENEQNGLKVMDRIENPDMPWSNFSYSTAVVGYANQNSSPFLPNFINDNRDCSRPQAPKVDKTSFCIDDPVALQLQNISGFDSIFLIDRSVGTSYTIDSLNIISVPKKAVGAYNYELVWKMCDAQVGEKKVELNILEYPEISNIDTTLCSGDSLELPKIGSGLAREVTIKNDGKWTPYPKDVLRQKGEYRLKMSNSACTSMDSFALNVTPPLLTSLGDSFSFCEEDGIPIMLDAGKGFEGYRWYPSNDRTRWINVKQQGEYYVVVNDSRGCTGRGDAKVYSDCAPVVYLPNAFSPNGNGINDSFFVNGAYIVPLSMQVYDRWGAIVHYAEGPKIAWNGTKNGEKMPVGMYLYILSYKEEFTNKSLTVSGPVYLLK